MGKATQRKIIENRITTLEGDNFQRFCNRMLLKLFPEDYTSVRAGGPKGDMKNDGYCVIKRIFFAAHATRGESAAATKKKIATDLHGCLKKQINVEKFIYLTNDTLTGEVQAFVDQDLRLKHSELNIETWDHQKITERILCLSLDEINYVLDMTLISDLLPKNCVI